MWSAKDFLKKVKVNAFSFAFTFLISVAISSLYPAVRDFVSWHAQYQLCQAAAQGKTTTVNLLLLMGANPDGFNTTYSPLLFAARYGQRDSARILLDAGASIDNVGSWRQTPVMEAVQARDVETAQLLLSRGASVTKTDLHSGTALWHAARIRHVPIVRLLMQHGGRECVDAESALSAAVEGSHIEIVRALLDGGVDPRDVTATHLVLPLVTVANQNRQPDIVKMLKDAGAK